MMRVIHVWLISIVFCFLWTFSCAAQVREKEGVLLITLESRQEVWDTSHPLEVDVKFENVGGRSEYIALKCGFGFQGNLTRSEGQSESLWYFIEWDNRSRLCTLKKRDFIEVGAGKSVRVNLRTARVGDGKIPWDQHPKGWYDFNVVYHTPKNAPFKGVGLGSQPSNTVRINVQ